MTTKFEEMVFKAAMELWGIDKQGLVCAEELSEASASMSRYLNNKCDIEQVYEELSDAQIMIDQMKRYFGNEGFERWRKRKMDRLAQVPEISAKLR